jgi:TetR/AcrR family tetracycline transcriptional repressor
VAHHREDVVRQALSVLDAYGLPDLTMRRLARDLEVQPSALYHHFLNKQTLLGAVADEILARGPHPVEAGPWQERARSICSCLRDACLAYRDGAEVVATVRAFGLGAEGPYVALVGVLRDHCQDPEVAARALIIFVLGHTMDAQAYLQAGSAGAIDGPPREASDFELGLGIFLRGLAAQSETSTLAP